MEPHPTDRVHGSPAQRRALLAERLLIDLGEVTEVAEAASIVAQSITAIGGAAWARVVQFDPCHGQDGPALVLAASGTVHAGADTDATTVRDHDTGIAITHADPEVPPIAVERALRALVAVVERIERQQQLLDDARTDPLTGLLNRRAFDRRLESELARTARAGGVVSLLLLDVDHFKTINDTHGHARGDRVLEGVAAAMRDAGRTADDLARVGGDEFALLLPDTDEVGAAVAAERLCARIRTVGHGVTASIGVATTEAGGAIDGVALLGDADDALYAAKRAGRDRTATAGRDLAVGA